MLHNSAAHLTDALYRRCQLAPEKRPILQYGFELITSTLCAVFSILLISIFFRDVYSAISFLGIFYFLRLCAGGHHAPTYGKCFILTNTVYLLVYFMSRIVIEQKLTVLTIIIALLSGIVIFCLAPIRNKKHPLSELAYLKNRKFARVLVTVEALVLITLILLGLNFSYLSIPVLSLAAVAVMMTIPKVQERSAQN